MDNESIDAAQNKDMPDVTKYVLAGHLFDCIKCGQYRGRLNKMDGTGEIYDIDVSIEEYSKKTDIMEEIIKNSDVKLLTTSLEDELCNKCSLEKT